MRCHQRPDRAAPRWSLRLIGSALVFLVFAGCGHKEGSGKTGADTTGSSPSAPAAIEDSIPGTDSTSAGRAVAWIQGYYAAINEHRYRDAYAHWARGGQASGKSFEEFQKGFAETKQVELTVGTPGPIEGAAGSRYVQVPVRIEARTRSGVLQRFEGTYTLRLSVVDGATPEQRSWHFESAAIHSVPP